MGRTLEQILAEEKPEVVAAAKAEAADMLVPEGWCVCSISEVAQVNPKKIDANAESDAGFVPMSLAPQSYFGELQFENKSWGEIKKSYTNFQNGDVIFAKVTPCFENGKAAIVKYLPNGIGAGSSEFYVLRPHTSYVSQRYIFSVIKSQNFMQVGSENMTGAVGLRRVPRKFVENYVFPLPPLAEQKVIADKLDSLLAQVETTKARLDRIPDILKRFRQSVLAAAVSGRLTEDWRREYSPEKIDPQVVANEMFGHGLTHGNFGKKLDRAQEITPDELPLVVEHVEKWPLIRIGALCSCVVPNRDKPKKFSGGYHWLLTPNFQEQSIWIDYSSIEKGLSEDEVYEYKAKVIKHGNVIMTCIGRVGLSAVLEEDAVINQQLHAFLVNKFIKPEYLAYCIRANIRFFEDKSTSTTVNYLNKTACNSLPIPLPPLEEQTEIVRRVEQLFTYADKIEQQVTTATERVNTLTQSILAKAFRGELTQDWRAANPELISGDNSAAVLLEKIKAERAAQAPKKRTRKKKS